MFIDPIIEGYRVANTELDLVKRSLFYFDEKASDFHEQLRSFLSKDIRSIQHLWNLKSESRTKFKQTHFGVTDNIDVNRTIEWLKG